ncbi:uncharacterized protein [Aegilops tauschii subsp. strangulata]|uniref:WPP domain-interacting protein 2 n=1 Tax=Aegilops tauschii subsp. strangulata TaxID=200361 RepID=A0A453L2K2_AEGTS|nr:WPP domain-interacting protein 2 [Aegilops tauschii subsp. strangulata]
MDSGANSVGSVGESPPPPLSPPGRPAAKGRGLRRWRRIPRGHHDDEGGSPAGPVAASVAAAAGPASAEVDLAQLHKRRLPVGADAPKGKQEAAAEEDSPVASVESSFVPPEAPPSPSPAPAPGPALTSLDPDLGLLIASAGFSVGAGGADSDNSDDRTSKSSTALPRHDFSLAGFGRDRDRARSRAPGAAAHAKNLRTARARGAGARAVSAASSTVEPENSRSSVESDLRSTGAAHARKSSAGISSNGVHKFLYTDGDHSDDEAPSEHLRSAAGGFYKDNGSAVGRMAMGNGDLYAHDHGFHEGSIGKGENGGIHSGLDPYTDSISMLQSAQEALENELQMFVEIGKESSDNSTDNYDENEWSSSPNCEDFSEEISEKLKLLESKLEEASLLIDEKDSRILELDTLNKTKPGETALYNSKLLSLQSEVDQLLMEKMEAEIQCFILKRASEAWQPQTEGQGTLQEAQKTLSEDHKQLEVKLRHTENRARTLEEMVEKLESQCKELSNASEVLKLQAGASRASLFCSVQLVLLCIAAWTFVARFLPSPPEFVPT